MISTRTHRFKDVLLALAAASRANVSLQRIQLQKLIYLMDVFSAVWREVSKPTSFEPEKRGPWDRQIQNAVDALAFRGLVNIDGINIRKATEIRTQYSLSESGHTVILSLCRQSEIADQLQLAHEIAREVGRPHRGWGTIKRIVYSEPTYVSVKDSGSRRRLPLDNPMRNQTSALVRMFADSWGWTAQTPPTREVFVQTLFLVFDEDSETLPAAIQS